MRRLVILLSLLAAPAYPYELCTTLVQNTCSSGSGGGGLAFGGSSGGTANRLLFTNGAGLLSDDADLTFVTDTLTAAKIVGSTSITNSALTATRVVFSGASGLQADDADMTFATDTLTITKLVSSGANLFSGVNTFGSAAGAINAVELGETAGHITFEGAAADTAEHRFIASVNAGFDTLTTIPVLAASQTIVLLEGTQIFSGAKTMGTLNVSGEIALPDQVAMKLGTGADFFLYYNSSQTPNTTYFGVSPDSNAITIAERTDGAFNFGGGPCGAVACINPHAIVVDKDQNTTNYQGLGLPGLSGKFVVTLTESSATSILTIPVADNTSVAGTLQAKIFSSDGTAHQVRSSLVRYVVVNEADTETCAIGTAAGVAVTNETDDGNISAITSGTLTYTWACAVGTNAVTITLNAVSSLTQTTLSFEGNNFHAGGGEPLPQ